MTPSARRSVRRAEPLFRRLGVARSTEMLQPGHRRASVTLGGGTALEFLTHGGNRLDRGHQTLPELVECIFDLRRRSGHHAPVDHAAFLELAQPRRQHFR